MPIEFDVSLLHHLSLNGEREDIVCATLLADITANWGRLEYGLYWILEAIDRKRGAEWSQTFTSLFSTKQRRDTVRKHVLKEIDDKEIRDSLQKALSRFSKLCEQRNFLAHSVWRRKRLGEYELIPLKLDKTTMSLKPSKIIRYSDLQSLVREVEFVGQGFSVLATELSAYQWLQARSKRSPD